MQQLALSLVELNGLVRQSIRTCLPDEYWVQAELSDVRANYSGHCYLEFAEGPEEQCASGEGQRDYLE